MTAEDPPPLLVLEDVRKAFGSVVVADRINLRVGHGETVGIVGPNGAGKTSLLNLCTGNLAADGGRILFAGEDVTRLPSYTRARRGVGRTYQVPRPFAGMTVFENVLLGAFHGARGGMDPTDVSVAALEATDLIDRANVLAVSLPLLDRKRLELARALATRPRLLLLDEIAGGLTELEVERLVGTIRDLKAEGLTIVWIEHIVAALMAVVDRMIAMDTGRILVEGDPAAVIANPAVQAVYLGEEAVEVIQAAERLT